MSTTPKTVALFDIISRSFFPLALVENGNGTYALASAATGATTGTGASSAPTPSTDPAMLSAMNAHLAAIQSSTEATDSALAQTNNYLHTLASEPLTMRLPDGVTMPVSLASDLVLGIKTQAGQTLPVSLPDGYVLSIKAPNGQSLPVTVGGNVKVVNDTGTALTVQPASGTTFPVSLGNTPVTVQFPTGTTLPVSLGNAVVPVSLGNAVVPVSFGSTVPTVQLAASQTVATTENATAAPGGYQIARNTNQQATATQIKAGTGRLYGYVLKNTILTSVLGATTRYVKFYDKASTPVAATDTPKYVVELLASVEKERFFPKGIDFPLGMWVRATTGYADNDTGIPASGEVSVQIFYY